MKEASGNIPPARHQSLSSAVNESQLVDVVSLEGNGNGATDSQDILTPVGNPVPTDLPTSTPATNGLKASSSMPEKALDSHRDQPAPASAIPSTASQPQPQPPSANSAETSSPPGGEEDDRHQELTVTGRPKRQATKKRVASTEPAEQPRRGSKPGPKPGRKKATGKTEKSASSSSSVGRAPIQDPFVNAHVHLQNDVDSEVLRILEVRRVAACRWLRDGGAGG